MKTVAGLAAVLSLAALTLSPVPAARAADGKVAVMAAENFYGDIARQIGGDRVAVVSIMNNPDQDPHLFETTPGIVRQIANAQIVILNGANYDPWMDMLLAAAPRPGRLVINVAALTARKPGDNPHLWYDPATMAGVAPFCGPYTKAAPFGPVRGLVTSQATNSSVLANRASRRLTSMRPICASIPPVIDWVISSPAASKNRTPNA